MNLVKMTLESGHSTKVNSRVPYWSSVAAAQAATKLDQAVVGERDDGRVAAYAAIGCNLLD